MRAAEARLEALRAEHYAAGDALHDKQGAFYAANAEVTRLEQQLSFARESETRIGQQVAQLTETIAAITGQESALADERATAEAARESARGRPRGSAEGGAGRAGGVACARVGRAGCRGGARGAPAVHRRIRTGTARRRDAPRQRGARTVRSRRAQVASRTGARGHRRPGHRFHPRARGAVRAGERRPRGQAGSARHAPEDRRDRCRFASAKPPTRGSATAKRSATSRRASRRSRRCRPRSVTARTSTAGSPIIGLERRPPPLADARHRGGMGRRARSDPARAVVGARARSSRRSDRLGRRRRAAAAAHRGLYASAGAPCAALRKATRCSRRCG